MFEVYWNANKIEVSAVSSLDQSADGSAFPPASSPKRGTRLPRQHVIHDAATSLVERTEVAKQTREKEPVWM